MPSEAPLHVFTSEDAAQLRESEVHADVLQLRGGSPRKQRELSETAVLDFPEEQAAVDAAGVSQSSIVKPSLKPSLKSASSPGFDSSGW